VRLITSSRKFVYKFDNKMTLHIYVNKSLVCGVGADSLKMLEPVFKQFCDQTGYRISEYDDLSLAPNHAGLLVKLIDSSILKKELSKELSKFNDVLNFASRDGVYLDLHGE
jgi:hypothetical protein